MADTELTDLTAIAAVADEDLVYLVDDPSGSPASRKATVAQLRAQLEVGFDADTVDGSEAAAFATAAQGATADTALQDVVDDVTPQLGGMLDVNGQALGDGTLELVTFVEDPSAVNHVEVENEASGSGPIVRAAGDDTDVDLNLAAKGTGVVNASGARVLTTADEGTGNGIDADTVDGVDASGFATAAQGATADTASQPGHAHVEADVSDLDHDAAKLQGVALDGTVASPGDGDILVYRTAGTDWVLEAKPAGGSNPALNDVTDVTVTAVADDEVLAFDNGSGDWINQTAAEAGLATAAQGTLADSALQDVVDDTTPQLGGQLDVNGQALGDGTLELLSFTETGSAVNHVGVTNAATGSGPTVSAVGDDTDVDLNLAAKGTGVVNASGARVLTTADEGTGNGIDADTVDGNEASALLARANHTGTQAVATLSDHDKTVHDALLIDADTVDGSHAAALLARANHTGTQATSTISDLAAVVKAYRLDEFANPTAARTMNGQKLTGLGAGTVAGDSLRYEQLIGAYLLLTGGTLSGALAMGGNKVTGLGASSAAGDAVRYEERTAVTINDQTGTSYTLVLSDAGKLVRVANAATHTLTVPPNSSVAFPVGTVINVSRSGAGAVTLAQGSGVTINSISSNKNISAQYGLVSLTKVLTDTWLLTGALAA